MNATTWARLSPALLFSRRAPIATIAVCLALGAVAAGCGDDALDADTLQCAPVQGDPRPMPEAKLYFEFNATDDDTGIHGLFDTSGFSELCATGPDGTKLFAVKPQENLRAFNMGGIFFESREPKGSEMSQSEILATFPAGDYQVIGTAFSGESLLGAATLTHNIALAPTITTPTENQVVDPDNLVIEWEPVTETVTGDPVTLSGYEVIVTNEDKDGADPHGMSHPIASIHVVPSVTSMTIPSEFLEADTEYELELIAIEESGNQTISVMFFRTP